MLPSRVTHTLPMYPASASCVNPGCSIRLEATRMPGFSMVCLTRFPTIAYSDSGFQPTTTCAGLHARGRSRSDVHT